MGFLPSRRLGFAVFVCAGIALAACQGNIGGGSGLSIPQAPGYGQPAGPNGSQSQSRERVLDGAVFLTSKITEVPLPVLAGFGVTISLGTPGPAGASAEPEATSSGSHAAAEVTHMKATRAVLASRGGASPSASASASAAASASPSASASASASVQPSGSASAGSPGPNASGSSPAPKPSRSATPAPSSQSDHPHIDTKTTIYPDDAPPPPTPIPTGEVQTFVHRAPIVRGYVLPSSDLQLYGLGAVHFTLPLTETTPKRGFTVAIYENGKHHHEKLMNYDTEPIVGDGTVYSGQTDPVLLKKGRGYLLMIYGDDEGPAPGAATVPPGYPSPGNNPFPAPSGSINPQPGYTQVPNNPYASPTPYNPYAPPTQYNPYPVQTPH